MKDNDWLINSVVDQQNRIGYRVIYANRIERRRKSGKGGYGAWRGVAVVLVYFYVISGFSYDCLFSVFYLRLCVHFLSFFLILLHLSLYIFKIDAIHSQLLVLSLLPFFSFFSFNSIFSFYCSSCFSSPSSSYHYYNNCWCSYSNFFLHFCILSFLSPERSYDYRILHLPPRPPPPLTPNSSFSIPLQPPFLSSVEAEEAIRKLSPQNSSTLLWFS